MAVDWMAPPNTVFYLNNKDWTWCSCRGLSEELWLSIFLLISDDCPLHSFTALYEVSAISKRAAAALRPRRAEHLRLALINLEVEKQYDEEMEEREQSRRDLEAFEDEWSIDSDGHWHSRFERKLREEFSPRPFVSLPVIPQAELQHRRLQLAVGLPTFPVLEDDPPVRPAPALLATPPARGYAISRFQASSPGFMSRTVQGMEGSPLSAASTIPADFGLALRLSSSFPAGSVDPSFLQQREWFNERFSR